jgi:adenylate cyclase
LLTAWADRYRQYSRDRRQMQAVVERFVPVEVISRFVEHHPEDDISGYSRLSFGICLATDAGRYTSLAESMDPMVLGDLMNEYWGAMFPSIRSAGGWISDVIGDAMLAIWTAPTDQPDVRRKALDASLTLLNVASEFERSHQIELPIRIGLHSGEMRIGYVGSAERGEYRAVGDTVNTAARIEALNKLLGTRVLATQMVVTGLESCFSLRRLGNFQLAGKNQLVTVYELMDSDSPETKSLIARFTGALDLFDAGRWQPALAAFSGLLEELPNDGPSQFYSRLCRDFLADPVVQENHRIIKTRKPDDSRRIWTPPVD